MERDLRNRLDHILLFLGMPELLRFVSVDPRLVEFRVTENCNSRCVMCNAWKNKSVNELSTEEMKNVLGQLKDFGIDDLIFLGGEPLVRPDIGAIVKEASLLKFRTILLVTNGLLLEAKAKELMESGVTHITVSLDGIGGTHDVIRGIEGMFDKAIEGIRAVQELERDMNRRVIVTLISMLLMKRNVDDIPRLIELSRKLDLHWDFALFDHNLDLFKGIPFTELLADDEEKIDKTIDYLIRARREQSLLTINCEHTLEYARRYLKRENLSNYHCVLGYKVLHLGSHGEVYPCWIMNPVGNLREARLRDIMRTRKYRELAGQAYMRQCPGCTDLCGVNIVSKHLISHWLRCEKKWIRANK